MTAVDPDSAPRSRSGVGDYQHHRLGEEAGGGGFDPDFFARLATVEARSFWFRARNMLIVRLVSERLDPKERFLEVGCGTGFVLAALSRECGLQVTGGELFAEALEYAQLRVPEAEFAQIDATAIPYEEAFDGVGAFDVLEHVEDDLAAIRGLRKAVRVGGHVFITVPQHPWLWSAFDDYSCHVRRYRRSELVNRVRQAGLTPLRITSFVSSLLPLMALSRWHQRLRRKERDPIADLTQPAVVDHLMERALRLELSLISRGANLPVGGTLVLVARRE
jgi:SAM-dependent methyltransferase